MIYIQNWEFMLGKSIMRKVLVIENKPNMCQQCEISVRRANTIRTASETALYQRYVNRFRERQQMCVL